MPSHPFYAVVDYTAEEGQKTFSIPFPYLDRDDVKVWRGSSIDTALPVPFQWTNESTIELDGPANQYDIVRVKRQTPLAYRRVVFENANILTDDDLNNADLQLFYVQQETQDDLQLGLIVDGSVPVPGTPGRFTEIRYMWAVSQPATPTGNQPDGWLTRQLPDPADGSVMWFVTAVKDGDANLWPGETWSVPLRVNGDPGIPGLPGNPGTPGVGVEQRFARGNPPVLADNTVRFPGGWYDSPAAATGTDPLYFIHAEINAQDDSLLSNWSAPVRLTGDKGDAGVRGSSGPPGATGPVGPEGKFWVNRYLQSATTPVVEDTISGDPSNPDGWDETDPGNFPDDPAQYIWWIVAEFDGSTYSIKNDDITEWSTPLVVNRKGDKGDTGDQGIAGAVGPTGQPGDVFVFRYKTGAAAPAVSGADPSNPDGWVSDLAGLVPAADEYVWFISARFDSTTNQIVGGAISGWTSPVRTGAQGPAGSDGVSGSAGSDGVRGSIHVHHSTGNTSWVDVTAVSSIEAEASDGTLRAWDIVTMYNDSVGFSETRVYSPSWNPGLWTVVTQVVDGSLIVNGSIGAAQISANSITANEIAANAITASEIAANAVTTAKIAANAVTATQIAAGTITANELAANSVTANAIASRTITAGKIAASTITANEIAANTISANEIGANVITASEIASSFFIGRQFTGGLFETRSLGAGVTPRAALIDSTVPLVIQDVNDNTIFQVADVGGQAEIRLKGNFEERSIHNGRMFSTTGLASLRDELGITQPSDPTGGITAAATPATLIGTHTGDLNILSGGLTHVVSVSTTGSYNYSSSVASTKPVYRFVIQRTTNSGSSWSTIETIDVNGGNVSNYEMEYDLYFNTVSIATSFERSYTVANGTSYNYRCVVSRISGTDVSGAKMSSFSSSEGVTGGIPAHTHPASDISSGTFSAAQIPNLSGTKITSGAVYDSNRLGGVTESESATASTIAKRNSSADIYARLFRSTYANQTTISGAMAYRVSTSDNYIRFCSDPAAIKSWLGISSAGVPTNTASKSTAGWWKCGDTGVVIQWAYQSGWTSNNVAYSANWPITFPSACRSITSQIYRTSSFTSQYSGFGYAVPSSSKSTYYWRIQNSPATAGVSFIGIGY